MRKATLAFSLSLCLFLTLSCTQNDDFLLEAQALQESKNFDNQSNSEKGTIDFDGLKDEVSSCSDQIANLKYYNSDMIAEEAVVLGWSYIKPPCNGICPPPGLIEYDIEVQIGNIGTYGVFWGTTYSFSHIESSAETELMHFANFDEIGGRPQLIRFRVKLNSCSDFSNWETSSPKFK